jgi:hypothetical protein
MGRRLEGLGLHPEKPSSYAGMLSSLREGREGHQSLGARHAAMARGYTAQPGR